MNVATEVRTARRRAGLTQRALAHSSGVAQPTIARIERGVIDPRMGTVDRLLRACNQSLAVEPRLGIGIDRSQMRELLRLTPLQRLELLRADVAGLDALDRMALR